MFAAVRSFALLALCRCFPACSPFSTRPTPDQPRHLLLGNRWLIRVACPRIGWFTWHEMRAHILLRAMGNHLTSDRSVGLEPSHTLDRSCLPPFPVPYPGVIRCRTVFHRYTCIMLKGLAGHRRPSASFPRSTGHAVDPCSHAPLSGDEQHTALIGSPHTRVPMSNLSQWFPLFNTLEQHGLPCRRRDAKAWDQRKPEGARAEREASVGQG
jgi:hypothetical protein